MIYLVRTTGLQTFYVHRTGLEEAGAAATLRIASTISGEPLAEFPVVVRAAREYLVVEKVAIPDTLQGEYVYEVVQDGRGIVASGLLVVGEPATPSAPAPGAGIGNIEILQYGE